MIIIDVVEYEPINFLGQMSKKRNALFWINLDVYFYINISYYFFSFELVNLRRSINYATDRNSWNFILSPGFV